MFQFLYCKDDLRELQDPYRGNTYYIPEQIEASFFPFCQYDSKSTSYTSHFEYSQELTKTVTDGVSAELGGTVEEVSLSASAAYSQENSVTESRELQQEKSGSIIITEAKCTSTHMSINLEATHFHPNFKADLARAVNDDDLIPLILKYGKNLYLL